MMARMSWIRSQAARALLAKLVMGSSALVALADSAPREVGLWYAEEPGKVRLVFAEQNERKALLSIKLDGPLYADVVSAEMEITATADRTASDLELSVRPYEPNPDESARAESVSEVEADFRNGFEPQTAVTSARPSPKSPASVSLSVSSECAESDRDVPREGSCLEQLQITLARGSQRPLSVDLEVLVRVQGSLQVAPEGTFEIHLEELHP